jgi:hypothetical protein
MLQVIQALMKLHTQTKATEFFLTYANKKESKVFEKTNLIAPLSPKGIIQTSADVFKLTKQSRQQKVSENHNHINNNTVKII